MPQPQHAELSTAFLQEKSNSPISISTTRGKKNKSYRDFLKNPTEPAASFFWPLIPPPLELYNIYKRRKMNFFSFIFNTYQIFLVI